MIYPPLQTSQDRALALIALGGILPNSAHCVFDDEMADSFKDIVYRCKKNRYITRQADKHAYYIYRLGVKGAARLEQISPELKRHYDMMATSMGRKYDDATCQRWTMMGCTVAIACAAGLPVDGFVIGGSNRHRQEPLPSQDERPVAPPVKPEVTTNAPLQRHFDFSPDLQANEDECVGAKPRDAERPSPRLAERGEPDSAATTFAELMKRQALGITPMVLTSREMSFLGNSFRKDSRMYMSRYTAAYITPSGVIPIYYIPAANITWRTQAEFGTITSLPTQVASCISDDYGRAAFEYAKRRTVIFIVPSYDTYCDALNATPSNDQTPSKSRTRKPIFNSADNACIVPLTPDGAKMFRLYAIPDFHNEISRRLFGNETSASTKLIKHGELFDAYDPSNKRRILHVCDGNFGRFRTICNWSGLSSAEYATFVCCYPFQKQAVELMLQKSNHTDVSVIADIDINMLL